MKIRGTASTVYEKYQALARDATTSGDRVAAENYFQHAEHYYRVMQATKPPPQPAGEGDQRGDQRNDQRGDQRDNRGRSQQNGQQNDQQNRDVRDNDARDDDASTGADDEVVEVTGEASGSATQAEATHLDEPVVDAADTGAIGVDKDQERAMPMNPAELAAMSESGRGARPTAEPQATEHSTAMQDSNGADNDGETAAPAPRRQPRRRRPAAEAVAAKADEASAPEPVVEDVEPS